MELPEVCFDHIERPMLGEDAVTIAAKLPKADAKQQAADALLQFEGSILPPPILRDFHAK